MQYGRPEKWETVNKMYVLAWGMADLVAVAYRWDGLDDKLNTTSWELRDTR